MDIERLAGLYAASVHELPCEHAAFGEAVVLNPGVVPGWCKGRVRRVDPEKRPIDWDAPPILDHSAPMDGAPDRPAPVYLFACWQCGSTLVIEECLDERGRTYFRLRNDYLPRAAPGGATGPPADRNGDPAPAVVA